MRQFKMNFLKPQRFTSIQKPKSLLSQMFLSAPLALLMFPSSAQASDCMDGLVDNGQGCGECVDSSSCVSGGYDDSAICFHVMLLWGGDVLGYVMLECVQNGNVACIKPTFSYPFSESGPFIFILIPIFIPIHKRSENAPNTI